MPQYGRLLAAAVCLTFLAGCSQELETYPVTGKVSFNDGTPLAGARVVFESTEQAVSSQGYTDNEGHYTLTTNEEGDGAVPGPHRVIVMPPPAAVVQGGGEEAVVTAPAKPVVAKKYQRYDTSGLQYEVKPGDNVYDIVLDKP